MLWRMYNSWDKHWGKIQMLAGVTLILTLFIR